MITAGLATVQLSATSADAFTALWLSLSLASLDDCRAAAKASLQ